MKTGQFDPRLESVRGLAALMVAIFHALFVYPTYGLSWHCTVALRTVFNGNAAVTMFFVLSGLVLGMGLQRQGRGSARDFCAYALRRVFRIYPVLVLSTAAILLLILVVRNCAGPHSWFSHASDYRPTVLCTELFPNGRAIVNNLLLLSSVLNPVTWTLGVEMISSLLLPLAHYARVRLPASGTWLLLAAAAFMALIGKWFLLLGWVRLEGAFNWETLGYFYLFYVGYLLPIVGPPLFARVKSSRSASTCVLLMSFALLLGGHWIPKVSAPAMGIGAWTILGVLLYGFELKTFRCLNWSVVRFFGRISYSFYLLHDLILICCARILAHYVFHGRMPAYPLLANFVLVVISVALAAIVAWATHRWIELPFIQLSKQLAGRLTSPRGLSQTKEPVDVSAGANVSA